jgi:serine/threonine protein kinase
MKRICQRCNVISQDFNLWCQEKDCPAEKATEIFDNGEWFGPMEIVQPVVITRSFIVYEARRDEEHILLKVANAGCEDKLRREARAFLQLAQAGQHPLLPVLLSAHFNGLRQNHPYGWIVINEKVKYYEVFAFAEGTILRNWLLKNPQPWYQHVGWIVLSIADVILYLHRAGKYHLCLNPDTILLRFDKQGIPRAMLIDLGLGDSAQNLAEIWKPHYNLPAYTAPEILSGSGQVGPVSDVYGLGMLFYEMLAGRPVYPYHLRRDETVVQDVLAGSFEPTGRIDLKNFPQIAEKAVQPQPSQRFADVMSFANALRQNIPGIPAEKKPARVNWRLVFIVLGALLAIFLIISLALIAVPV